MNVATKLAAASVWLRGLQSTTWNQKTQDRVNQLVTGCVYLLSQSIRSHKVWVARNDRAKKIKGRYSSPPNNKALRDLVELTISDVEACSAFKDYLPPWQLEEFGTGYYTCEVCGAGFTAKRKAKVCSRKCRNKLARITKRASTADNTQLAAS